MSSMDKTATTHFYYWWWTCRYDDGMCDKLPVPLSMTAFISGKTIFDNLLHELQM